jgi:hypothetical protein
MVGKRCWLFALFAVVLSLAACSSAPKKQYIEPDDPEIDACIRQCNVVKVDCRDTARERYDWCRTQYEYKRAEYQRCVASGGKLCFAPTPCPGLQVKACTQQYDDCFQGCGGIIREPQEGERKGN